MATGDTELMLDVGQANELKLAARRAGATNTDLKRLCEGDTFAKLLPVIRGLAVVTAMNYFIDLDANPFIPEGWKVEEHKKGGKWKFDPKQVKPHLSKNQMGDKTVVGNELRKELSNMPVMNANLLDWYLAHPEFIPEEWKGKAVFFWGTIYRNSDGYLYARSLYWDGGRWYWSCVWLGSRWYSIDPALVLAS